RALSGFAGGVLLFGTVWEPYSAKTIGAMRARVEGGQADPFGVVFFENTREEIAADKSEVWYFSRAYVLAPQSEALRPMIGRVPFRVMVGASGAIETVIEGKAEAGGRPR